jgi:hypothetical protein
MPSGIFLRKIHRMKSLIRLPGFIAAGTLISLFLLTGCANQVDHIDLDAGILKEDIRIAIERAQEESQQPPSASALRTKVTAATAKKRRHPE